MNDIIQNILNRRSIRAYEPRQINDEDLDIIIEAGKYAPSGANTQLWHFSVIQNENLLDQVNAICREGMLQSDNPRMVEWASAEDFSVFHHAPTLIVMSGDESALTPQNDCTLAMENMFLAARSLEIGSCWMHAMTRFFDSVDGLNFREVFCIPEGYKVFAAGVFGYPSEGFPEPAPRREGTVDFIR